MATSYPSFSSIAISNIFLFLSILSYAQVHDPHHGTVISLNMIHRDAPSSPLYNSSQTNWQRVTNALRRSHHRITRLSSLNDKTTLIFSQGEYMLNMSIGTPPRSFIGIVDTGSDLIWTQCMPCTECFVQYPPLFDPTSSSTYKALSCTSDQCRFSKGIYCSDTNTCDYRYSYAGGGYTAGNLSLDTVTLDSVSIPNTVFGCGHRNGGVFNGIESGIIGLGSSPLSFISQIGYLVGGKYFSYCLVPTISSFERNSISSKIYFGRLNNLSGPEVVTTPLLSHGDTHSSYFLELQGISVGAINIPVDSDDDHDHDHVQTFKGNIIIDSGTLLTFLPEELYGRFDTAIREALYDQVVKQDPAGNLGLCFWTYDLHGPAVTFHFNGADVKLKPTNIFIKVDEETVCLAFAPTRSVGFNENLGIYGNWAQINFLVGYDLENMSVSFQSTDCTS